MVVLEPKLVWVNQVPTQGSNKGRILAVPDSQCTLALRQNAAAAGPD